MTATRGVVLDWTGTWEPQARLVDGYPTWPYRWVPPRLQLATRRQLRARVLCPGGHRPVAVVEGHRRGIGPWWAWLYRTDLARPSRPQTEARRASWEAAMTRRRTCDVPGHVGPRVLERCVPRVTLGGCPACWEAGRCTGTVDREPVAVAA